ncbi:MAG: O-antigen/teichoic acid export membrane protein, partial [Sphingobacteriales bacterium]
MKVSKQVASGVKWTTLGTGVLAGTNLIKYAVLARLLEKTDFGLMALVTLVMGFMELFNDMGLTSAILHKQDISKNEYSSLYWLNVLVSLGLYLLLILISPFITGFYNEPQLAVLIPIIGINLLISAMGRMFKTIEQKQLLFKSITIIDIISALISLIVAVSLAFLNYGVYSLVYSLLVQFIISNILYLILGLRKYGLSMHFNLSDTKPFLSIGMYQVGGQTLNYFNRDFDILIIGKFFPPEILGGYSLAKQLVMRPIQILNPILSKVGAPALAKFQGDINRLKENYLKLVNVVSSVNIIIYSIVIVFAPLIIRMFYGPGFQEIEILVRILSLYMILRSIGSPVGSLVIATGKTHLDLVWNSITFLVMPVVIYT